MACSLSEQTGSTGFHMHLLRLLRHPHVAENHPLNSASGSSSRKSTMFTCSMPLRLRETGPVSILIDKTYLQSWFVDQDRQPARTDRLRGTVRRCGKENNRDSDHDIDGQPPHQSGSPYGAASGSGGILVPVLQGCSMEGGAHGDGEAIRFGGRAGSRRGQCPERTARSDWGERRRRAGEALPESPGPNV